MGSIAKGYPRRPHRAFHGKLSLLLLMLSASLPTWSRDTSLYTVEVIVFESLDQRALQSELWPADPGAPPLAGTLDLGRGSYAIADFRCPQGSQGCPTLGRSLGNLHGHEKDFQLLPATEHRLGGVIKNLESSGRYRTLVHLAWQQPALDRKNTVAVRIEGGAPRTSVPSSVYSLPTDFPYIDGSVRLYRGRYLHVLADLMLYRSEPAALTPEGQQSEITAEGQATPRITPQPPNRYRLIEHRRMRSGELNYLDHPLFGLLIQVTPYHGPRSAAASFGDAEAAGGGEPLEDEVNESVEGDED